MTYNIIRYTIIYDVSIFIEKGEQMVEKVPVGHGYTNPKIEDSVLSTLRKNVGKQVAFTLQNGNFTCSLTGKVVTVGVLFYIEVQREWTTKRDYIDVENIAGNIEPVVGITDNTKSAE